MIIEGLSQDTWRLELQRLPRESYPKDRESNGENNGKQFWKLVFGVRISGLELRDSGEANGNEIENRMEAEGLQEFQTQVERLQSPLSR